MTARGTITTINLARDNGTATAALTAAAAAGFLVPGSANKLSGLLIRVVNSTTAGTMMVRAPGNGNNAAGNAQTSPYPSNAVFAQGAVGDLSVTWGTVAGTTVVGPFTSDRYTQPDGNLYVDFNGTTGVTFEVFQLPYNAV